MRIKKQRIRSLKRHLFSVPTNSQIVVGIDNLQSRSRILNRIGFSDNLQVGETVLPSGDFGNVSLFNAEGKFIKLKDKPMETAYRQMEWHWVEWHGKNRVDQSKIVDVPYKRFPRKYVVPPSIELTIAGTQSEKLIISPVIVFNATNSYDITHRINLFLEIFGECVIFQENLQSFVDIRQKRLNWEVLPPGKMPWEKLKGSVRKVVNQAARGNQTVIWYRFEKLHEHDPEFYAVGEAGFRGYVVFGYPGRNIYIVESIYTGNATYVFEQDWKELTKLTKAQIIAGDLHKSRIIHRVGWENKIEGLFS